MAKQARLNNSLLKALPWFCPTLAELFSNLKALVQRCPDICCSEILPLLLKTYLVNSLNLSLGFKTKCKDPIFYAGTLQEAK